MIIFFIFKLSIIILINSYLNYYFSYVLHKIFSVFFFSSSFFFNLRATLAAYRSSQARGRIGAVATSLSHSHSMLDLSHICNNPHHSSWQFWIPNPLSEARDQARVLTDPNRLRYHWATMGTPSIFFLPLFFCLSLASGKILTSEIEGLIFERWETTECIFSQETKKIVTACNWKFQWVH